MIKDRTPASKRRAQQQQQQALSRTIASGASAAGHTADPARVVVKSEMPACGSGVRIKLEPSTTLDPLQLPPPPLTPSSNSPCSSSIDGVAKNSLLESSSSSGFIGGVPVGHVKRERVDSAVATATTCLDSNAFNNNINNNGAHSIASEFMLSDSAPLTSAGHGSGGVSCASVTQAQAAAAAAACNQPAALSSSGAAAAVINKQPMTADAQYMQQQSHIFVFSTQLANRAFEAVVRCQFPTIIAFHCAQPGTRKYLDRHPLKLSQFSRGGGGGGWESANGRRASNSATATVALSTAPVSSRPQSVGLVGSPAAVCGTVCTTSGQPHDAATVAAGGGSVRPHSASAALPAMQPIRTSTAPALPAHSAASPSVANGGAAQFAAMTACSPAPAVNTTCGDDAVSRPLTSVQRLSDEDLTPEQRHHRASQLAALRRLGEMLLPDQHHQQAQQQQQQPPGAINGAAVPNGVAAPPAVSPMVAADGTVLDPRMPVSPAVPPGAGAPMMDARFMGPGAPVDPRFMAPGGPMMEHRMMAPAGAGGGPMMVPVGPMMEHRMMTPAGGGPMMEHRMMGPAGMAGGGMPVRMMAGGGGGGGACMMVPNGAVTSMAAQMEWHRLQSEFYDERRKKTGAVGGGAMMMAAGTVVPAGMRMMMPARMQGPPPPYPQTQVRTSVATAAGVPVGSMVVPSPGGGGGGGGGGGSSPTTSLPGVASPRLNSPSVYPRLPTPGPSPGNPVPSPSPRHFNSNPGTPASVGAPAGVTASAVPSPAAGAAVRVAAPEFTPPHSQPSIAAGVPTGSVSPANSLQCSAGGDMFARTAVNSVCAGGGGGANLMPVPSPQQIQYINNFEGQELTIHKQPNTGIRDDTQSVLSPSVSSCSVSAIGSPLLESGVPAGGVRVGVASPRLCHQQQQQHHQHHHHQMSPRFPAPALVDCMPPAGAGRFASPCSMPSAVNKGMVYMERFPMAGCGGMVTRMPRAAAPGAFVDARMSCPEMDMSLAHVPLNPQHPAVMCGGGGAGMPAGGGGGGGGPERVFDPISSMVQMSQQLTGGSPSSSSTGGGGGGGGFMSGGVMDAGVASPASSTCSGMTGAAAAAAALSPRLMSPSCHAQQQPPQPPQSLAASPKPGNLTPQHHQQQFMNVSVAGGMGGVMPVRMMARPVTPCGGGGGVPTSVQVKPGAPNTIQYLPSRAQCMAGPGGGAGVRGAPPNQFQFHPHHPHLHHQQPQQVMMSMPGGGGGGMCPVDPQQHQPQPHMQHMMSARGMMPCAPSNMMMGPAPGGGAMMMAGGPAGGAAAVPSMHHMTTSGPRAGPMMMRQTSVGPMTMMPMSGGGGDCSAAQCGQPMMAAVGPSSAPSAMFGPAGVQSGKPHMMRPDAAQPLPPSMAQPGAAIKQAQFAAAQPPSAGWFN